jgi:predicted O-linked N-acetylglucosamine transferase (SPINDLY family)
LLEDNADATRNLKHEARLRGIEPERLIFAPRRRLPEHLARLDLGDLFLDALPYNAHTSASDALWVGLPVLTCLGETFAGRVAAALLHAIGLPELVASSLAEYEQIALALALDPGRLAAIKTRLRHNRDTAPLFDTTRFTRDLETAYETMWERQQAGLPPSGFSVVAANAARP